MDEDKKKALIVTALAGFIRSFLTHDIQLLQNMGYEVHCAANINHPGADGMEEYFRENSVEFHQIDFSSNKPISKETLKSLNEMKNLINSVCFDIVHCHTPIAGAVTRWLCRKQHKNGMKVIYTTHGFYFHKDSSKKTWIVFRNIENIMSHYCDAIITINKEDYSNALKMHAPKVYLINGVGVDTNKYKNAAVDRTFYRKQLGLKDTDLVVLAVGELSERKNQKVVVQAIAQLNESDIVFVHCGNAMNKSATTNAILNIAKEKNVRVKLLGLRKDIPEICKCADIGTISSTREGLGLAGIEMLASGLPMVASNVHGILDYMVDGVNGYLANPYRPEEFAVGIKKLLSEEKRKEIALACSKSVEKFDKSVSYEQMKKIYKEILG